MSAWDRGYHRALLARGSGFVRLACEPALRARAYLPEALIRVDTGRVAVAPVDPDGVIPDGLDIQHLQRRLEHRERIVRGFGVVRLFRLCSVRSRAGRTGAFVTQVGERILAPVPVLPVDLD